MASFNENYVAWRMYFKSSSGGYFWPIIEQQESRWNSIFLDEKLI